MGTRAEEVRNVSEAYQVYLINEKDDVLCLLDFIQHCLQALLKFSPVLAACHQRAHVQGDHACVLEHSWHIALHNALRQALNNGCLPHTCMVASLADVHSLDGLSSATVSGKACAVSVPRHFAGAAKVLQLCTQCYEDSWENWLCSYTERAVPLASCMHACMQRRSGV